MNTRSINQIAQECGETSRNEADRIRERQSVIARSWRTYVFNHDENPTAEQVAEDATRISGESLGVEFVKRICEMLGYTLKN